MAEVRGEHENSDAEYDRPLVGELCRMTWLAFGPASLIFSSAAIWKKPSWTYSWLDLLFWGIAAFVVIARFVDITVFRGRTTDDTRATVADGWRYSAKLVVFAAVIWLLAQWTQG